MSSFITSLFFFFNDTATTEIYTLSLHDALPISIEILSDILGDDSENAEAWRRLGLCYLETAQPDFALEALMRAVKADPGHATAHYLLGNAYGTMGRLEQAAACYRRARGGGAPHPQGAEIFIKTGGLL